MADERMVIVGHHEYRLSELQRVLGKQGLHIATAAQMRVLELMSQLPTADLRETVATDGLSWPHLCKVFEAELARRETK